MVFELPPEMGDFWGLTARLLSSWMLLYPELHYRFRFFPFSRYFRKEPEILADAPYRLEPDRALPFLVLIKDAHRFPVTVRRIAVQGVRGGQRIEKTFEVEEHVETPIWHRSLLVQVPPEFRGEEMDFDVIVTIEQSGRTKTIHNDNLPGLSHRPLTVFLAEESQPALEGWFAGDLHYHTDYTSDQVEFGAPLEATVEASRAMGLNFVAATDHSYDLDDREDDCLARDADLSKWTKSRKEIRRLNETMEGLFTVLAGEEVTCSNAEGRNVHLLVLGDERFHDGSGDGAERWLQTDSEYSIVDLLDRKSANAIAIAAHPCDPAPILEKRLILRGRWEIEDWMNDVTGFQILNGLDDAAFREGLRRWSAELLKGRRVFIYAGNDAHGNFNRFRQVKLPMVTLHEKNQHQRLGWARTFVWLGRSAFSESSVLEALRQGRAVITTGPMAELVVENERGVVYRSGDVVEGRDCTARCRIRSSKETGFLTAGRLMGGGERSEVVLREFRLKGGEYSCDQWWSVSDGLQYIRLEVETSNNLCAFTNPVWFPGPRIQQTMPD